MVYNVKSVSSNIVVRSFYQSLKIQDVWLGRLACRAMKWRGFSPVAVHPKHLFDEDRGSMLHELLQPGINFLDLGSGVGSDCIVAKQRGARKVVGVEGNQHNINKAVVRAEKAGVQVEFIACDLEQAALPVADNTFDIINFSNVLEHLDNRVAILRDLKNKKKAGGRVVISIPNSETGWKKKLRAAGLDSRDDEDHKVEYSEQSIQEELACADLHITSKLYPIIPSFPWNGLIAMSAAVSPALYRRLQRAKQRFVQRNPQESIGWVFTAR